MYKRIKDHPEWKESKNEELINAREGIERYIIF
jgi:hypothetical protein